MDRPDAVLFDLYGTLVREAGSDPSFAAALAGLGFESTSTSYMWLLAGLPIAPLAEAMGADVAALRDASLVQRIKRAADLVPLARSLGLCTDDALPEPAKLEEIIRKTDAAIEQTLACERLFDGAKEVLDALRRRGVKLALISNVHEFATPIIRRFGLAEYFSVEVLSCRQGAVKPDEAMYRAALGGLGVPARRAVVVGDSWPSDIVGALRCGIPAIWLDHGQDGLAEQVMERRWDELADRSAPDGSFRVRPCLRNDFGRWIPMKISAFEASLRPSASGERRAPEFLAMCRRVRDLRDLLTSWQL